MHYENIVNICSCLLICLVAFTPIARSEEEKMNPYKVKTPLLLIHGDQDFIPFEQAQEMFIGLARLEKGVVLLKYKEADHWPGFWSNEKLADYWERVLNWFDEYLK